jgi:hypothetical protein
MDAEHATLTVRQAYQAMLLLLERECELSESGDLAELLAEYGLTSDGTARDPDAWAAWLRAVDQVAGAGKPAI